MEDKDETSNSGSVDLREAMGDLRESIEDIAQENKACEAGTNSDDNTEQKNTKVKEKELSVKPKNNHINQVEKTPLVENSTSSHCEQVADNFKSGVSFEETGAIPKNQHAPDSLLFQSARKKDESQSHPRPRSLGLLQRTWLDFSYDHHETLQHLRQEAITCAFEFLLACLFCLLCAMTFVLIEGDDNADKIIKVRGKHINEELQEELVLKEEEVLVEMWNQREDLSEERFKHLLLERIHEVEVIYGDVYECDDDGATVYEWGIINAFVYMLTVTTSIGYGHISPSTTAGQSLTIVYAILGIPIFLILMADFGKLFTRLLKSLFVFFRRLYRSATCRRVRNTPQIQKSSSAPPLAVSESLSGELDAESGEARRRALRLKGDTEAQRQDEHDHTEEGESCCGTGLRRMRECWAYVCCGKIQEDEEADEPHGDFMDVDDNFNLPISLALLILLIYIFVGCIIYTFWESWTYFEAFYFIFISMTTIGFGDYVPEHPAFMMMTTVYLVFGLALTAMCINIIQEKLTDTFRRASEKLKDTMAELMAAATLGEEHKEEIETEEGQKVEVAEVHGTKTIKDEKEGVKKEK